MEKTKRQINNNELFAITNLSVEQFRNEKNGGNALLLYFGYQQQSRMQKTNQSRSTDKFMIKKMKWSKYKFGVAKKILLRLGFIEVVNFRKKGRIGRVNSFV